jgi:uncharacterized membrane protein YhaH (DUF805 family)
MFTSPLGRGRFFVYSAALLIAEAIAAVLCIMGTLGIKGLADSPPGSSREPLALAILVVSVVLFLARSNIAWRRSRDAEGSKWILAMYVVFSAFFALLQAATFLIYDFNGDNSNLGLNLLGLVIIGLWFRILLAPSAGGSWDAGSFAATVDAEVKARRGGADDRVAAATLSQASATLASAPEARTVARDRRGGGFGKRGLA